MGARCLAPRTSQSSHTRRPHPPAPSLCLPRERLSALCRRHLRLLVVGLPQVSTLLRELMVVPARLYQDPKYLYNNCLLGSFFRLWAIVLHEFGVQVVGMCNSRLSNISSWPRQAPTKVDWSAPHLSSKFSVRPAPLPGHVLPELPRSSKAR